MKAFIERVFMAKKNKKEELLNEELNSEVTEQATEAAVEAIIKEVKEEAKVLDAEEFPNFIDRSKKD
jgi:hypothetical protein